MNLAWKKSMAEFMGFLHANNFNDHRLEYPSLYFSTIISPFLPTHTHGRKITRLCMKEKDRKSVNLDTKELMDGPYHSSYAKDF